MSLHLLNALFTRSLTEGKPLRLLLRSRHQIVGRVKGFDNYVLLLERKSGGETRNPVLEIVYRHALAAVSLEEAPLAVSQPTRAPRQRAPDSPENQPSNRTGGKMSDVFNLRTRRGTTSHDRHAPHSQSRHSSPAHTTSRPSHSTVRHTASPGEKQEERMNLSMEEEIRKWIRSQGLPEPKP